MIGSLVGLTVLSLGGILQADVMAADPGPRGGPPGAGGPLPGLSPAALQLFLAGQAALQEIDSVQGTLPDTGLGLGPRFNLDSCGGCHAHPAPGGASPPVNPQVAVASQAGATNPIPFFITRDGPIRHAHVKRHPDGTPDGHVAQLYTITGRVDAPGCQLQSPDFEALAATDNLAFHIPLPLFGVGLIDAIDAPTILANLAHQQAQKQALGIRGRPGGLFGQGRFGWKAQGTSLPFEVAGAYQTEVGVTNPLARQETDETPGCQFNPTPEDTFHAEAPTGLDRLPDVTKFTAFVRFLAPPTPTGDPALVTTGQALFAQLGCALCHTPALPTGASPYPALRGHTADLYSDLALHHMGPGLADGVVEGNAGPDEFRTAPLWGLGQRLFFLHDGRTSDLLDAIRAHASQGDTTTPPSEANAVIDAFNGLSEAQQQTLLDFLRAL
jgi:CxxC motif-containing protein (DUF1111 family)